MQPTADLGPRYQVAYRVPGPSGTSTIIQDVYPYAKPSPVTYVRAGQRFWTDNRTYGGWFVSTAALKTALVDGGIARAPSVVRRRVVPVGMDGRRRPCPRSPLLLALRRRGITRLPALRSTA